MADGFSNLRIIDAEREVQLAVMVPERVKRAVRRHAEREGTTLRGVLLRLLCEAGVIEVGDLDLGDRRASAAALRTRIHPSADKH
ncbi:hypothetical protein [Arenibaculum pallidiluteum]|uniref:hypothetical protein n=1 Tax=Arenibaculum pallidiluteum TaxID=2812559 RepID=UPI001A9699D0|nr:hypothetical protein [Arenibaculum pallidiluteum]